jgi:hypothetical protein
MLTSCARHNHSDAPLDGGSRMTGGSGVDSRVRNVNEKGTTMLKTLLIILVIIVIVVVVLGLVRRRG